MKDELDTAINITELQAQVQQLSSTIEKMEVKIDDLTNRNNKLENKISLMEKEDDILRRKIVDEQDTAKEATKGLLARVDKLEDAPNEKSAKNTAEIVKIVGTAFLTLIAGAIFQFISLKLGG